MILVRWHWSNDDPRLVKVETFNSKASAKRWIKGMTNRPEGEAYAVIVDWVGL